MFLTKEILEEKKACGVAYRWFLKKYPDGVELSEIISSRHVNHHMLHWGYDNLDYNQEEEKLYYKALKVENSTGVYKSNNILDSSFVSNSSLVRNSKHVLRSEDVKNSNTVISCEFIEDSQQIFASTFVFNSTKVHNCNNVNNSSNVVNSTYVVDSHNVFEGNNISNSFGIYRSSNLSDCYFCSECRDIKHAICSQGIEDGEYYVFNTKVDEKTFDNIKKQFLNIMEEVMFNYVQDWPLEILKIELPTVIYRFPSHYQTIPSKFWKWVKTLPNYSNKHMFYLTSLPEFLTK